MFPVTGVSELNGSSKYTPEDCRGNGWELFSELTCGFSFVSLIRRKKKKNASGSWLTYAKHFSFVVQRSCIETKHTRLQFYFFFFFFCHTSLRCSEMNTDGYNRALGSVCDWCLIPEVGQNHSRPNHSFLSALVKHEVSEERGFFFCSSLLYFWIIFVLKCATGRPLSQNVWQLWLWVFGVNGAGWDDEVS